MVPISQVREVVDSEGTEAEHCLTLCGNPECTIDLDDARPPRDCTRAREVGGEGGSAEWVLGGADSGGIGNECEYEVFVACKMTHDLTCEGRRHESWRPSAASRAGGAGTDAGAWYARAAANEAGSVRSFRALARELRGTAIGKRFAGRFRRAARDEIRHARVMRGEALRRGSEPARHDFAPESARSLAELALENAREGCVLETWAALLAHVQARSAPTARARRQFRRIAEDETRHAELAWDLHRHLSDALDERGRAELEASLLRFLDAFAGETVDSCLHSTSEIGLPAPELERALRGRLASALREQAGQPTPRSVVKPPMVVSGSRS
jgi:hypothetical protein